MPRFEFEPRPNCLRGSPLDGHPHVRKMLARDEVMYRRCRSCSSWCQSPTATAATLTARINSEAFQGPDVKRGVAYVDYPADENNLFAKSRGRYERDSASLLRPESRGLDIGCAGGTLSLVAFTVPSIRFVLAYIEPSRS